MLLYPKIAAQNIKTNRKFYFPYILTIIGTVAAFYILCALANAESLPEKARYAYLSSFMFVGTFVVALFAVIFLFYTNSFLMKRRKQELGLYNILGMGKRHIAVILGCETLFIAVSGIGLGLVSGMLFQKLVTLVLMKLINVDVYYTFYISPAAIIWTVALFSAILLLTLLLNLRRIHVQNPIELLSEGSAGEREPKTRWALAALGVVTLGAGYYIAMAAKDAMAALALYFVAVFLVIIGTYCLFTAVSIAVLKLLRKNKKFYYRTKAFIGVSGMLYRMKRNAVGLANICILSTMVLVMVSGTLSLYLGTENAVRTRCPADIVSNVGYDPTEETPFNGDEMEKAILDAAAREGVTVTDMRAYEYLSFTAGYQDGVFTTNTENFMNTTTSILCFITADCYRALTGEAVTLTANQVLLLFNGDKKINELQIDFTNSEKEYGVVRFDVAGRLKQFPIDGNLNVYLVGSLCYAVVADDGILNMLYESQLRVYDGTASSMSWMAETNVDATSEQILSCTRAISEINVKDKGAYAWDENAYVQCQAFFRDEFLSVNGGFFFLGVFLGVVFIMAMVLIIYYKQISEGYEDRQRYQIMRKVGLPKKEIRASVNAQMRVVFFAPLIVAAVHILFDYRLMIQLLTLFGLVDASVTLWCSVATFLLFALIYGGVYALTTRVYLKIVS